MNQKLFYIVCAILVINITTSSIAIVGQQSASADQERGSITNSKDMPHSKTAVSKAPEEVTLFLAGDVMTGRGIDQILPHPGNPAIYESYMRSARGYVQLAEKINGIIPIPVDFSYIWGDALSVLASVNPDLRIINLETSVTKNDDHWPKGINYRMHPENIASLTVARINGCILANNHVLDWKHAGLVETLDVLERAGIQSAGAGKNQAQASTPAIFDIPGKGRLLVFAYGSRSSGVPSSWAASKDMPGINVLKYLSFHAVNRIKMAVAEYKQPGDIVLLSLHWGDNWGYDIPSSQKYFARKLLDDAGVDAIYGHSSHHVKGIEIYKDKLILYGCGDFLNDYEGIDGYDQFRDDLTLMYFPSFDPASGKIVRMRMMPMQIKRFQIVRATTEDSRWLVQTLNREGKRLGTRVKLGKEGSLELLWD